MQVVQWEKSRRRLTSSGIRKIYSDQLTEPIIFRFTTSDFVVPPRAGTLSLKLVLRGQETYRFCDKAIPLTAGQFLIVDEGEHYASEISSDTESLSIFLPNSYRVSDPKKATDPTHLALGSEIEFANAASPQMHSLSGEAVKFLNALLCAIQKGNEKLTQQAVDHLIDRTYRDGAGHGPYAQVLNSKAKASTKSALLRRLTDAKAKIDQSSQSRIDLDELAREAGLSVYYFNRLFREAFGKPPAAYARLNGLSKAAHSISIGGRVTKAARQAGYGDLRSFRRAVTRIYGEGAFEKAQD